MVESGQATFQLGDETIVVDAGHVVVGPPDVPTASRTPAPPSSASLRSKGAPRFNTELLLGDDPVWTSQRRLRRVGASGDLQQRDIR